MTAVPTPTFGANGFQVPAETDIVAGAFEDINAAFGGNLNPSPSTPQGQFAASIGAIVGNCNSIFLLYTNLVDPALSYGRMQDAVARIYFIERIPSSSTVVQCECIGQPLVQIPAGSLAQDENGNIYVSTQPGIIPLSGSVTLSFANQLPGPIPCGAGSLNVIYQAIPGWDSITNVAAGALGSDVETSTAFEARRSQSVALNSVGSLPSILGAVLSVQGVLDCYVYENATNAPLTVGGVSLVANSVYVCVLGGAAADIAQAIWSRKAPGCAYNGNTTVTVYDKSAGYIPPYPAYQVSFETPLSLPILMAVSIANGPFVPANAAALIQNAIISAFAGGDGGPRARIGGTLFASRFYSTIASLGSWARIVSILLGSTNTSDSAFNAAISGTTMTVFGIYSGSLVAGQTLFDTTGDIVSGTVIGTQISGSAGGVGAYNVSIPQTVGLEAMSGVTSGLFEIAVNINQAPTISASNIIVTLI